MLLSECLQTFIQNLRDTFEDIRRFVSNIDPFSTEFERPLERVDVRVADIVAVDGLRIADIDKFT